MFKAERRFRKGIFQVEVLRFNEKSVWVRTSRDQERREGRLTDWAGYFETWAEAKELLVTDAGRKLKSAEASVEMAQKEVTEIEALVDTSLAPSINQGA